MGERAVADDHFEVGNIVTLWSGGERLTVSQTDMIKDGKPTRITCLYINKTRGIQEIIVDRAVLKKV